MTYQLKLLGLPVLTSLHDLSAELRLSEETLHLLISRADFFYKTYQLKKKSGGYRTIAQPSRKLKAVQGWILTAILNKLSASNHSKGFEIGSSILDNAVPHSDSNFILNIDVENFFENVGAGKVYLTFKAAGYTPYISRCLTRLCTYKERLPQGAPTSPKLANLACLKVDARINGYAGSKGMTYTRYADDITISGNNPKNISLAKKFITRILADEGLPANKNKVEISGTKRQKKVTGLILGSKGVGVGTQSFRKLRAEIHQNFVRKIKTTSSLAGKLAFLYHVDQRRYKKALSYISNLEKRYSASDISIELKSLLPK